MSDEVALMMTNAAVGQPNPTSEKLMSNLQK